MNTPKEKADELTKKFYDKLPNWVNLEDSKQCALIAVDEIIEQWETIDAYIADFGGELNQSLKYWQEVKKEI